MTADAGTVRRHLVVEASVDEAFRRFTDGMADWWPRRFTFRGAHYQGVVIEPFEGGRWFERVDDGSEIDWGEVRAWEPPNRLVLSWRVGADRTQEPPERASEVEIRFVPEEPGRTMAEVQHREFERHGDGAEELRQGMASEDGWQGLLEAFAEGYDTGTSPSDEALT